MKKLVFVLLGLLLLTSCMDSVDEKNLSEEDLYFLRSLNVLAENEAIEKFECNGSGIRQSGNFITSDRIVSYWIEDGERQIDQAFFSSEIDTMTFTDLSSKLTYASFITVAKMDGATFNVYIDADSSRTAAFFRNAQENWVKYRRNN